MIRAVRRHPAKFPLRCGTEPRSLAGGGRVAEEQGYTSLWTSDHILVGSAFPRYGHIYEALVTLAIKLERY